MVLLYVFSFFLFYFQNLDLGEGVSPSGKAAVFDIVSDGSIPSTPMAVDILSMFYGL
jgi:hypothetical protein